MVNKNVCMFRDDHSHHSHHSETVLPRMSHVQYIQTRTITHKHYAPQLGCLETEEDGGEAVRRMLKLPDRFVQCGLILCWY
jgi:hypothetical protein